MPVPVALPTDQTPLALQPGFAPPMPLGCLTRIRCVQTAPPNIVALHDPMLAPSARLRLACPAPVFQPDRPVARPYSWRAARTSNRQTLEDRKAPPVSPAGLGPFPMLPSQLARRSGWSGSRPPPSSALHVVTLHGDNPLGCLARSNIAPRSPNVAGFARTLGFAHPCPALPQLRAPASSAFHLPCDIG